MKILYFTGTGNSLFIAKQFGGELFSIPQLIKNNEYTIKADKIGVIIPIYYLDAPKVVDTFLKKASLESDYVFLIFTYGGLALDTYKKFEKYGIDFSYVNYLKMPENFIPFTDMKKSVDVEEKLESEALNKIIEIKRDIINNKIRTENFYITSVISFLASKFISKSLKLDTVSQDDYFYIDEKCTSCKVCEKVCPVNNISISEEKVFKNNCIQCMGCIQSCPSNAIQHLNQKSINRFTNRNISLEELIKSNQI